ncbi:hypothetical protein, partial [Anaerosporobacter sp.]
MPTNNIPNGKQTCAICKKEKRYSEFYASNSEIYSLTRRVPACKSCMLEKSLDNNGDVDLTS